MSELLFSTDFRNRSAIDKLTGNVPTNSGAELVRGDKGICSRSKTGFVTYPAVDLGTDDFSLIVWTQSIKWKNNYMVSQYFDGNNYWYLRGNASEEFEIYCRDTTGNIIQVTLSFNGDVLLSKVNGISLCIQLNFERGVGITGYVNQWPVTASLAGDPGRTIPAGNVGVGGYGLGAGWNSNTHVYKAEIHSGKLTEQQMADERQCFLHSSPTSTPAVIRHKIAVDPTGSVLCHNYQNWRGGIVPDLSGNGNDGTPHGFVDASIDGARFNGIDSYIQSSNTGMTDTNYFIEMLIRPHDVNTNKYICDQAGSNKRAIVIGNQNGYFNFYDGVVGYPTGLPVDTQIPAYQDKWQYLVMGTDGTKVYGYSNGVKIVEETGDWGAAAVGNFYTGAGAGVNFSNTDAKFVKIHNSILTEAKIQANWNSIANQAIFNEPMFNQLPDNRSYTTGMYLENWQVSSGAFTVKEDSTGTYIECTGNGVIQYKGIDFSMYKENGFIKKIVGDISSDQGVTVDTAVNVAFASNTLSVTLTTGQKLYELVITKGEEV